MSNTETRGETHGCIVCGKPYQLYVVYDINGKFLRFKVMSAGGKAVEHETRPLVACESHTGEQVNAAVRRVYGAQQEEDE